MSEPPSIYVVPQHDAEHWTDKVSAATGMGFNAILMTRDSLVGGVGLAEVEAAAALARQAGLAVLIDLDIAGMTIAEADDYLAAWQGARIAGFRCLGLAKTSPAAWNQLMDAARDRDPKARFIAATPGLNFAELALLQTANFDYSVSSSCWWDFRAGWLDAEMDQLRAIAPSVAMAAPPGVHNRPEPQRRRALRFAAFHAAGWMVEAGFEAGLTDEVTNLNALRAKRNGLHNGDAARLVSSPGADVAVLVRGTTHKLVMLINASPIEPAALPAASILPALGLGALRAPDNGIQIVPGSTIEVAPSAAEILDAHETAPVVIAQPSAPDLNSARIAIESITPQVDQGQFPVRRVLGEVLTVEADLITDGHDKIAGELLYRAIDETPWRAAPLAPLGNDRWSAAIPLERLGRHVFMVAAWKDFYASFVDEVTKKHAAGVNIALELQEGTALITESAKKGLNSTKPRLKALLDHLKSADEAARLATLLSEEVISLMREADLRKFSTRSHEVILDVERLGAAFANWYEIFPRSQSGDPDRHGTFRDVIKQLPRIARMGFDVLYFPPIHPIGRTNRKGKNNTLTPGPDDPGSPYAIGAAEGGHDAIHPELGTLTDLQELIAAAAEFGIELALDFAIQCAPDHPWLKDHPEWFDWRPDGSLRYAENPPKKYQDIVNVDFYAPGAKPSLWLALRDVVQFWADQGIRLFRVDNPHTKPLPFWEWLIADIRARHPDCVFLAEAFTRPKLMYRLAKIGFSQSYTYFTWRNTKAEFEDYMTELTTTAPKDFFRPHFFVNTPDINPIPLQTSGRGGFLIRAALAATLSGLWGVYNGFELCEATPVPGREEYLNSEKYEIRAWDHDRPGNIIAEISQLNRIRRANAALHTHLNIEFLPTDNDQVLYFRKTAPDGNCLLIAISLDSLNVQNAILELPLWRFGIADDGALDAEDLMRDFRFIWHGKYQPVSLSPTELPFCIWRVSKPAGDAA